MQKLSSENNYGNLLAEIQYFESIGNYEMAESLSTKLEKARLRDKEVYGREKGQEAENS